MDNIINISSECLNQLPIINNSGSFANIYRINNGDCLKIWKVDRWNNSEKFNKFSNLNISSAIFPKKLVMVDGQFKGYTMNYVNGINFEDCDNFDFSFFLNKFYDLMVRQEKELSPLGIIVDDIHSFNIMWDNVSRQFICVDIDNWVFLNLRGDIINNCNFKDMVDFFASFIFDNGNFYYYDALHIDGKDAFLDFYISMRDDIQEKVGKKLTTVRDVKKVLRRI